MNLLFVNDIPFNPIGGGLERVTDVLSKELIKRGHNVYYLCGKLPDSKLFLLDYPFPAKLFQLPNFGLFGDSGNVEFCKKLLEDCKIDIVVNQRGLGGWFNDLLHITNTKKVSVIHSTPEANIVMPLNEIIEYSAPPLVGLKRIVKKTFPSLIKAYKKKKITNEATSKYNELALHSSAIVTLSKADEGILKHLIKVPNQIEIVSIPNPNTFSIAEVSFASKEKEVLYVGRLKKDEKEPMRLIEIWKSLERKFPNWRLRIVGDGREKENMQQKVKSYNLKNVFFEGRQSDVAQYYKKASFICLTSNFEGWGMVLTEGMQYGCIPMTFNNYGAAYEIIDDGINGCLIPAFSLKHYRNRLAELMLDDKKRNTMMVAAKEKVEEFSVENVVEKWEDLFRSL